MYLHILVKGQGLHKLLLLVILFEMKLLSPPNDLFWVIFLKSGTPMTFLSKFSLHFSMFILILGSISHCTLNVVSFPVASEVLHFPDLEKQTNKQIPASRIVSLLITTQKSFHLFWNFSLPRHTAMWFCNTLDFSLL